jgi:hypothetical protein
VIVAADEPTATCGPVVRRDAIPGSRITFLARVAGHRGAAIDAIAGVWVLHQTGIAGHWRADAATAPLVELLPAGTLGADALLVTADLIGAARVPIRFASAFFALTGGRIELTLGAGVDTLILAADLASTAVDIDTGAIHTGFAGIADGVAVATVMAVDLGIDALAAAFGLVIGAGTFPVVTGDARITGMSAAATVVGVGRGIGACSVAIREFVVTAEPVGTDVTEIAAVRLTTVLRTLAPRKPARKRADSVLGCFEGSSASVGDAVVRVPLSGTCLAACEIAGHSRDGRRSLLGFAS